MSVQNNRFFRKIYNTSPPKLQSLAVSLLGLNIRRTRYDQRFEKCSKAYRQQQWKSAGDWQEDQLNKLEDITTYAKRTTEHYSDIDLDPIRSASTPRGALKHLPFLESETLRQAPETLVSSSVDTDDCIALSTSGTTGTPKTTYHDEPSHIKYWAVMNRFWGWGGCRYGDRRVSFTGNKVVPADQSGGPYGRYDRANNRLLLSSYHLGEETVDAYLDEIEEFEPDFIDGYPSSIRYCAQRAIETDRDIEIPACFPTAEMLREEDRSIIEDGLSTKVYNQYGSTESAAIVTECSSGHMHVNPEIGIIEVLDEKGETVSEGEVGEIVLTALNNRAMPLIRYRIGDMARGPPTYRECECGREMPIIEEIIGRQDEVVVTKDGRRVPMLSYNVFKYTENVSESRIVQESHDEFLLQIVPDDGYTDEQAEIAIGKLKDRVGEDINVKVETLDSIPRTDAGKFRAVVSKIDN